MPGPQHACVPVCSARSVCRLRLCGHPLLPRVHTLPQVSLAAHLGWGVTVGGVNVPVLTRGGRSNPRGQDL